MIALNFNEFIIEIYKFVKNEIDLITKSGYYGLGLNNEQKDLELILIDELKVNKILSLKVDKKIKNIIYFQIINEDTNKKNEKNKSTEHNCFDIVIDFSSINDSKKFIDKFKDMTNKYKSYIKRK